MKRAAWAADYGDAVVFMRFEDTGVDRAASEPLAV